MRQASAAPRARATAAWNVLIDHSLRSSHATAIIFASSDNQEVLGLADTVATFFRGRIVRVSPATEMEHSSLLRDVTHPDTLAAGREAA